MKRCTVLAFVVLVFMPILLSVASGISNRSFDAALEGYTEKVEKPTFNPTSFFSGEFQSQYNRYFEESFQPKGVYTKTYATLQYDLFSKGNRYIGKNRDIFENNYINGELCLEGMPNYAVPEQRQAMQDYVDKLVLLQEKLNRINKFLFVCVTPSKANFDFDNILEKTKHMASQDRVNAAECFSELIAQTDVPHMMCRDRRDSLAYPAFYPTGIHWSRTFEQETNASIIRELSALSGKKYRSIILGEVVGSSTPFWRDADVFNLLNVWHEPKCTYYEYVELMDESEEYDRIRLLIQGSSFSKGFFRSVLGLYPNETILYINRDISTIENGGREIPFATFDDVDMDRYLDSVDGIMIETVENELSNYSNGFVDYLLEYLDSYVPGSTTSRAVCFDGASDDAWNLGALRGIYGREVTFAWATRDSLVMLNDPLLKDVGMEIACAIPSQVFTNSSDADVLTVTVNGSEVWKNEYTQAWEGVVYLPPEALEHAITDGENYDIELRVSKSFVPQEIGENDDTRDLAIRLMYVGRKR